MQWYHSSVPAPVLLDTVDVQLPQHQNNQLLHVEYLLLDMFLQTIRGTVLTKAFFSTAKSFSVTFV